MLEAYIRSPKAPIEFAWFCDLCNGDYEYLGVPDQNLKSSFEHCRDILLQADELGFDNILLPSSYQVGQDVMSFASAVAPMTSQISLLTALRMGEQHPPMLARSISTLDHILKGRLTINIINSDLPGESISPGDRYDRARESILLLKQAFEKERIQHAGEFYQLDLSTEPVKSYQQNGGPLFYFGGISEPARNLCAEFCDVFLMWPEKEEMVKATIDDMVERAAGFNRKIDFGYRVHIVVRKTAEEAKAAASKIISKLDLEKGNEIKHRSLDSKSQGVVRQDELRNAADSEGYIEPYLWSEIGRGRSGCGSAIVGSKDQVLGKLQRYIDLGIKSFILSGYPLMGEAEMVAKYILPHFEKGKLAEHQKRLIPNPVTPLTTGPRL
jgi:alkanesulfonate monooxygenase